VCILIIGIEKLPRREAPGFVNLNSIRRGTAHCEFECC
jgi:hypothetical protein